MWLGVWEHVSLLSLCLYLSDRNPGITSHIRAVLLLFNSILFEDLKLNTKAHAMLTNSVAVVKKYYCCNEKSMMGDR